MSVEEDHGMMTAFRFAALAFLVAALGIASADAQCSFQHPGKAKAYTAALVQAMLPCGSGGGPAPNTTTETGTVPACAPAETYNELVGSPANGWLWGPSSKGAVRLKAAKNKVIDPLNPPDDTMDLWVHMTLDHVFDANGAVANAPGTLVLVLRFTMNDRQNGDMTAIDFPIDLPFAVVGNRATLKTSLNARLNEMGIAGLPHCTSMEVVDAGVRDENGTLFATAGIYLP
jgi:hypothetical protein